MSVNNTPFEDTTVSNYQTLRCDPSGTGLVEACGANTSVVGSISNCATATGSFVGGGHRNIASCQFAVIAGGKNNTASNYYATVVGGFNNEVLSDFSFIGGGCCGYISANYSAILGGCRNSVSHAYSAAFGCGVNSVCGCTFHANNFAAQDMAVGAGGPPGTFYIHNVSGTCYVAIN